MEETIIKEGNTDVIKEKVNAITTKLNTPVTLPSMLFYLKDQSEHQKTYHLYAVLVGAIYFHIVY